MQPISNCLAPPSRSYLKGGELIVYYTLTFDEVALTYLTKHSQKKYQGEPITNFAAILLIFEEPC